MVLLCVNCEMKIPTPRDIARLEAPDGLRFLFYSSFYFHAHLQCVASSRTQIALFPLRRERQNWLEWSLQSHLNWAQRGGLLLLTLSCSQLRQWME